MSGSYGEMGDYAHQDELVDDEAMEDGSESMVEDSYNSFVEKAAIETNKEAEMRRPLKGGLPPPVDVTYKDDVDLESDPDEEQEGAFEHTQSGIADDQNFDDENADDIEAYHKKREEYE
jgi:hypothetical protein